MAWHGDISFASRLRTGTGNGRLVRNGTALGLYAITGGLGGLGLQAAKMLIENSIAGSVLVSSRSGLASAGDGQNVITKAEPNNNFIDEEDQGNEDRRGQ